MMKTYLDGTVKISDRPTWRDLIPGNVFKANVSFHPYSWAQWMCWSSENPRVIVYSTPLLPVKLKLLKSFFLEVQGKAWVQTLTLLSAWCLLDWGNSIMVEWSTSLRQTNCRIKLFATCRNHLRWLTRCILEEEGVGCNWMHWKNARRVYPLIEHGD